MNEGKLLRIGIIGTVVAALCCFTPLLMVLLSAAGLAAVVPALDFVLMPLLAIFIGITGYALWMRKCKKLR
ncbi:MAG: mercury resistance system transport protein MerF [Hyphomicrobiales bacterium]